MRGSSPRTAAVSWASTCRSKASGRRRPAEGPNLWFRCQDMRLPFGTSVFDYVFNLFTSFGYFADLAEHLTVVQQRRAIAQAWRSLRPRLPERRARRETSRSGGDDGARRHHISHQAMGRRRSHFQTDPREPPGARLVEYTERVAKLTLAEFRFMFEICGMSLVQTYGDYDLSPFDVDTSPRLIMAARKCERGARALSPSRQVLADAADGFGGHAEVGGEHHLRNAERNRGIDAQELEVALLG